MSEEKILRFTASWCQPCKQLEKTLKGIELDIPVEVIDIDTNQELVEEYNVRGVPCLVHLPTKSTLVGSKNKHEILGWLSEL